MPPFPVPFTLPWKWRHHGLLKCWYPTTSLHDVITQKTKTWLFLTYCLSSLESTKLVLQSDTKNRLLILWQQHCNMYQDNTGCRGTEQTLSEAHQHHVTTFWTRPLMVSLRWWICSYMKKCKHNLPAQLIAEALSLL